MYEQLLETCEKQVTQIRALRAERRMQEERIAMQEERIAMQEERIAMLEERIAELRAEADEAELFGEEGKGKGKGKGKDKGKVRCIGDRCDACGSLLYIPITPASQRVMYDSDEWHALQEQRYRVAEAKGQAKGGKSATPPVTPPE